MANSERLPQLDAMRGLACLLVVIPHVKSNWNSEIPDRLAALGVGLFFVLSGFLITRVLIQDQEKGRGLGEFYNRRVARIFPVYFLTLGIVALIWPRVGCHEAAIFTYNWLPWTGIDDYHLEHRNRPPIGHLWSLCVEEHFYWFWPPLLYLLPRRLCFVVLGCIALLTPLAARELIQQEANRFTTTPRIGGLVHRHTLTQLTALALGAIAARYEGKRWLFGIGMVMGGIGLSGMAVCDMVGESSLIWHPSMLHLTCGGLFLVAFRWERIGRIGILRRVGSISYAVYVYHLPIYSYLGLLQPRSDVSLFQRIKAITLTLVVAAISYGLMEQPIQKWVRSRSKKLVFWGLSPGLILTFLLAILAAASLFQERRVTLSHDAREIDTVVLGSSHAMCGIATPHLPGRCWNLANSGQDLYYDVEILKKVAPSMPRLRRVIVDFTFHSLHHHLSDTPYGWRELAYLHDWQIPPRVDRKLSPHAADSYGGILANSPESYQREHAGWRPFRDIPDDGVAHEKSLNQQGFAAADRHNREIVPGAFEENTKRLLDLVHFCQSHRLELIIISCPTHSSYRKSLNPVAWKNLNDLLEQHQIPFHDYSADARFLPTDFADPDHLNLQGALKLTSILDHELKLSAR